MVNKKPSRLSLEWADRRLTAHRPYLKANVQLPVVKKAILQSDTVPYTL